MTAEGPTRLQRRFVVVLLVLFCVPGVIGFDLWPLTGWRLFSANRGPTQTRLLLESVAADGSTTVVDPDDLPYRYRSIEWPMMRLPGADQATRAEVCEALLEAAVELRPDTVAVRVIGEIQALVEGPEGFEVEHHPKEVTSCRA